MDVLGMLAAAALLAAAPPDDPPQGKLPVVVLIGDSIRLGYAPTVIERLKGKAEVVSPAANGGDSGNVLKHLDEWAIRRKPTVVHFNAGLHDLKFEPKAGTHQVELDPYRKNLAAIRDRLERETNARLIFATTTPVLDDRHNTNKPFHCREADVEAYNAAALEVLTPSPWLTVNDLHATVEQMRREDSLGGDGVHFTPDAYKALGERVAAEIEAALKAPEAATDAVCRKVATAPAIDGKLDDDAWKDAPVIDTFPSFWSGRPSGRGTRARLVWDDEAIYFSATMTDAEVRAVGTKHNDSIWLGDVFELFFKPEVSRSQYYEFEVNPRGLLLELSFPRRGYPFEELAAKPPLGTEAVVAVDGTLDKPGDTDRGWSVEGKIPWTVFAPSGGRPAPGAVWRFALCRYDYGPEGTVPTLMSSAPLRQASFHRFEDYGCLRFEAADR